LIPDLEITAEDKALGRYWHQWRGQNIANSERRGALMPLLRLGRIHFRIKFENFFEHPFSENGSMQYLSNKRCFFISYHTIRTATGNETLQIRAFRQISGTVFSRFINFSIFIDLSLIPI
jgi:hypothetical protein